MAVKQKMYRQSFQICLSQLISSPARLKWKVIFQVGIPGYLKWTMICFFKGERELGEQDFKTNLNLLGWNIFQTVKRKLSKYILEIVLSISQNEYINSTFQVGAFDLWWESCLHILFVLTIASYILLVNFQIFLASAKTLCGPSKHN